MSGQSVARSNRIGRWMVLAVLLAIGSGTHAGDYTFSCWQNGWRKNAGDRSPDLFGIETNYYGFSLDVANFDRVSFGRLTPTAGYEQALGHRAEKLAALPPADLSVVLEVDGRRYEAKTCAAGKGTGVKRLSAVRLWESGRFVQHYDFLDLDFRDAGGEPLECEARLDLVAWPGSLTFSLHVAPEQDWGRAVMRLGMSGRPGSWAQEREVDGVWAAGQAQSLSLSCALSPAGEGPLSDITVETAGGRPIPVRFDPEKNCQLASVNRLGRDWKTGYTDIREYDEFKVTVAGAGSERAVPFLLDLRPPANVTGVCPILCHEDGTPTGIPLQLSKNWHYEPTGSYVMTYAMLPAAEPATYLLRFVYGFYGTLPSASHAQLCLVGYGGNGRWDQLAIGCWGETICFDMDMSLVDVAITDIRLLMARSGIGGRKWGWTNAGWGGDWLHISDRRQRKYFPNGLKTAYLSHGPCMSDVRHEGNYGSGREVEFSAQIQTLRTDDYCRTFQQLSYTFTQDVVADGVSLFRLGRSHTYQTPRISFGNRSGLIEEREVPESLEQGQMFFDGVELTGAAPHWVAFTGASESPATKKPKPNGYRALIVRAYELRIGDTTYTNPVLSAPVHAAGPPNLDIELRPPSGIRRFGRGDRIYLDLELITLPRVADDYYGPNESFRQHLLDNPNSWRTTYREAQGNRLEVSISGGRELRNYPLVIQAEEPVVNLTIIGGIGAVPVRFEGLAGERGYHLYQVVGEREVKFDQSVHGNDFWQTDFDPVSETYHMTFNLPLDGLERSVWVLRQEAEAGGRP